MSNEMRRLRRPRHDGFFRSVFADTRVMAAEVQTVLPEQLTKLLTLDKVEAVGARFAEASLRTPESDAVFQISTTSGTARVFVLLEHQRNAPRLMPFRVLRYVTGFWAAHLKANPTVRRLPPIVPLVVANVPGGWTGPRSLEEILEGTPSLIAAVRPFLPQLDLVIDDLSTLDVKQVLARPGPPQAHLAWWLLSVSTDVSRAGDEADLMRPTMQAVRSLAPGHHREAMVYLRSLPMTATQRRRVNDAFQIMSMEEYRKKVPFLQDIIRKEALQLARVRGERLGRKEGLEKGLQEGREQGLQKGLREGLEKGLEEGLQKGLEAGQAEGLRQALLAIWQTRFRARPTRTERARLKAANATTLARWLERALTARRSADVFD
jgi:hypothetical protein